MSQRGMAEVVKLALTWENGSSERPGRGQAHGGVPGVGLKTVPGSPPLSDEVPGSRHTAYE